MRIAPATWLRLARLSHLPTVWSGVAAAWWLGGGGHPAMLALVLLGAGLVHVAGMILNDASDAEHDRQYHRERPIPSGEAVERPVWKAGYVLLGSGLFLLLAAAWLPVCEDYATLPGVRHPVITSLLVLALGAAVLAHVGLHQLLTFSPALLGVCHGLLFLAGGSYSVSGLTGTTVWWGFAVGFFAAGPAFFARTENLLRRPEWWPCLLLLVPVALAWLLNPPPYDVRMKWCAALLVLWCVRSLRPALWSAQSNVQRAVPALTAGLPLAHLLAVCAAPGPVLAVFPAMFVAALLAQRLLREG